MTRHKIIDTPEQLSARKTLGILVRTLRASLGWSQRYLGDMTGVTHVAIAKVEMGTIRLLPEKRVKLLALFEQAGVQFQVTPGGITITLRSEVLAKVVADEAREVDGS